MSSRKFAISPNELLSGVAVIVPTYNASRYWGRFNEGLSRQGISASQVVIIDSSSTDDTRALARREGYQVACIATSTFNHGATRRAACDYVPRANLLVFMTQDAILASPTSIADLCRSLGDPRIGAAYGRQLPREDADPIERHGRLFSYGTCSHVNTYESRKQIGFKATFFSNSFAVYRRSALEAVGSFPTNVIVSEEVTVIARMLMAGWHVAYSADAAVYHSHSLTLRSEFARYFDIGVHHGREKWLIDSFGNAGGEGRRFVFDELQYLSKNNPAWIPYAIARIANKYLAYHLGKLEKHLPRKVSMTLSAHPNYWTATPEIMKRNSPAIEDNQTLKRASGQ